MNRKLLLMLCAFSIFTGATFHLAKYTSLYFSASSAAAWRFSFAAILMSILLHMKEKFQAELWKKNLLIYVALGIIGIFGFNSLFFLGINRTSALNGALIMASNPLITTLFSRIILKTKVTSRQAMGISLSLCGVLFVIAGGSWQTISSLSFSTGDLFLMMGNLCWALYGVLSRGYVKQSSPLATTSYSMIVGAICLVSVAMFQPNVHPLSEVPIGAWGAIAFMAIFSTVLGYLFWNEGIARIGASKTSIFFNLVPVVTMVISFLLGMDVTLVQIIGTLLVISGVFLSSTANTIQKTIPVAVSQ